MGLFSKNKHKRRVLVVDDEFINRALLGAMLEPYFDVSFAENGAQALEMMRAARPPFSLVLLDLLMPVLDGFSVLTACRGDTELSGIPIIVMTSEKDAEVKSIQMGAMDFIAKPYDMPDVILARCQRIIEMSENRSIIRYTEKDALTGLYSKEYFIEYIRRLYLTAEGALDAVVLNIDRFSFINEMFGRQEGDRLLKKTAGLVQELVAGDSGIGCRRDGDVFCVCCPHREDYEAVLQQLNKRLSEGESTRSLRVRAGIYSCADRAITPEIWFDRAKTACNRIRGDFNRCTEWYNAALHAREMYCERLVGDVRAALEQRHFKVYYQPKYRIQGGEPQLTSAEALIRWQHPELGMISPGDFIPLFEKNGLIRQVDYYVWREAAAQISRWKQALGFALPVSVNVSRVDIFDPELEDKLLGILREFGLTADELIPEITESAYSDRADKLIEVVSHLRGCGFKIEMDDFGTGYSSLHMLAEMPIDVLKMDMKFIRDMLRDDKSLRLVQLLMDIAQFLHVPVVAEGVEEKEQLDALREMGCEIVQGYYFSGPVPPERFESFIKDEIKRSKIR